MSAPEETEVEPGAVPVAVRAVMSGFLAAMRSVTLVNLVGIFLGFGAIARETGIGLVWTELSTALMMSAPAQLVVLTGIVTHAPPVETAIAVSISAIRFAPMVATTMVLLRHTRLRFGAILLPMHCMVVSLWVESMRLLPAMPRDVRVPFCNGLAFGFLIVAVAATMIGYGFASGGVPIVTVALQFATPMAFLVIVARGCRTFVEGASLGIGLLLGIGLPQLGLELDVLSIGVVAGVSAFAAHHVRGTIRWRA